MFPFRTTLITLHMQLVCHLALDNLLLDRLMQVVESKTTDILNDWEHEKPVEVAVVCVVRWSVVWCGVVWCGVVWCGVGRCGVVWCGVVWCGVVWCGVVWCGVVWCGVVWCGVVWYGMVRCGVWYVVTKTISIFHTAPPLDHHREA